MSNQELQKELKEKVKLGIKPSDLKKKRGETNTTNIPVPPPLPNTKPNKNEQKTIKQLQQEVNFWEETARSYLADSCKTAADLDQAQLVIQSLREKQPEPLNKVAEKALIEANQKIRELQSKCKELQEKLKEQKTKPTTKEQGTQTELTYFYCDICQLNKHGTYIIRKVDSPLEPRTHNKICYVCASCSRYSKEVNDTTFDKDNNPYKLE